MNAKLFEASLPQAAFSAKQVLENEAKVSASQDSDLYILIKGTDLTVI